MTAVTTVTGLRDALSMTAKKKPSPKRHEVTLRFAEAKMLRLQEMAEDREMPLQTLLHELLSIGIMSLKSNKPKCDPFRKLDIDPEFVG
jgi:hypothetical protein